MSKIKYNINLNVKVLKDIFSYFDMNENNTIIRLVSKNQKVIENLNEYKENIIDITNDSVYLKNMNFAKLFYILSKSVVLNIYYYKLKNKNFKKINNDNVEVFIHTRMDKIHEIYFNEKYDFENTKLFLKKYRKFRIDYIIIALLILFGLLIRFGR